MSTGKDWKKILKERSPLPIVSESALNNGDDFLLSSVNTGYSQFKLTTKGHEKSGSKRSDFELKLKTEFAQQIITVQLSQDLIGCQRERIGRTEVGRVMGKSDLAIGDVSIKKFVTRRGFVDFFSLLKTSSIMSKKALGQEVGGFTHPTIQLSGGPCVLPFHIEHWAAFSVNYLHWGKPNVWFIISPDQHIPAMYEMEKLQGSFCHDKYRGVCEATCSHRDIVYDIASFPKHITVHKIVQMPGEIMVLAPFALHSVQKLGTNCAESQNFLPAEFLPHCAPYKTCLHSEGVGGKPLFNHFTALLEDLHESGKIELKDFIHDSDPHKDYKLRVVKEIKRVGDEAVLKDVIRDIKLRATNIAWFKYILPMDVEEQPVDSSNRGKYYDCPACDYATNHNQDLKKHIERIHGDDVKMPETRVDCPKCGKSLACLRRHTGRPICENISRSKISKKKLRIKLNHQ